MSDHMQGLIDGAAMLLAAAVLCALIVWASGNKDSK